MSFAHVYYPHQAFLAPPATPFLFPTIEDYRQPFGTSLGMAKRKRKSAPKTKSGCRTCKERHVKCGEEKPGCARCVAAGRICGGYDPAPRKKNRGLKPAQLIPRSVMPSPTTSPGLADFVGSPETFELQQLEYFRLKASASLAGPFDAEFWNSLLVQASRTEPCIRYAMVAVASMHQHFLYASSTRTYVEDILEKPAVTLTYYNKAITALNTRITGIPSSTGVALMCCILFTCLETIQGNTLGFVAHVQNGQRLIAQWRARTAGESDHGQASSSYLENEMVEKYVVPYMAQLHDLANTLCIQDSDTPSFDGGRLETSYSSSLKFHSLLEARTHFTHLKDSIVTFSRLVSSHRYANTWNFDSATNLYSLKNQLRIWRRAFDALSSQLQPILSTDRHQAAISHVLEIQYHSATIWLATALSADQSAFDEHFASLQTIVDLDIRSDSEHMPTDAGNISWSLNLIPQLVFVAMLCRDPTIRGQAIDLLRRCIQSPSPLSHAIPSLVANYDRWWDMESSSCASSSTGTPGPFSGAGSPVGEEMDPLYLDYNDITASMRPESGRLHFQRWLSDEEDVDARGIPFYNKPWGLQDDWFVQQERLCVH